MAYQNWQYWIIALGVYSFFVVGYQDTLITRPDLRGTHPLLVMPTVNLERGASYILKVTKPYEEAIERWVSHVAQSSQSTVKRLTQQLWEINMRVLRSIANRLDYHWQTTKANIETWDIKQLYMEIKKRADSVGTLNPFTIPYIDIELLMEQVTESSHSFSCAPDDPYADETLQTKPPSPLNWLLRDLIHKRNIEWTFDGDEAIVNLSKAKIKDLEVIREHLDKDQILELKPPNWRFNGNTSEMLKQYKSNLQTTELASSFIRKTLEMEHNLMIQTFILKLGELAGCM